MTDGPNTRVLLVDDDRDLLALLQVAFTMRGGFEVRLAGGAAEARTALAASPVDVVVTDGDLGDGSGRDLLAFAGEAPVVLLSGSVDGAPDTLLSAMPFAAAVAKPFNPLTLPGLIDQVLMAQGTR